MKKLFFCFIFILQAFSVCAQNGVNVDALVKEGFAKIQNKATRTEALEKFNQVIKIAPEYVDAYIGKAIILKRNGQWSEAKGVLWEAHRNIKGNQYSGRYLAETAWQEGFYAMARALDREFRPAEDRKLMSYANEVVVNYGYDWVDNRDNWWEMNFTYQHRIRPDHSFLLYHSDFRRDADNDFQTGFGYVFRWNYTTTFSVDAYFSDESGFTAKQKYRPRVYFRLPYAFTLGLGGNFDKIGDDWAKVSYTDITKYFGDYYGKYTLLTGKDTSSQDITTHIGEIGYEKEDHYIIRAGYATGNESIERIDRFIDASVDVDTYFINGKYFVTRDWGLNASLSSEYRNSDLFRTSLSSSVFYRF